ncbi:MAG: hypothetical protein RR318_00600 [Alistipes sp.]
MNGTGLIDNKEEKIDMANSNLKEAKAAKKDEFYTHTSFCF